MRERDERERCGTAYRKAEKEGRKGLQLHTCILSRHPHYNIKPLLQQNAIYIRIPSCSRRKRHETLYETRAAGQAGVF